MSSIQDLDERIRRLNELILEAMYEGDTADLDFNDAKMAEWRAREQELRQERELLHEQKLQLLSELHASNGTWLVCVCVCEREVCVRVCMHLSPWLERGVIVHVYGSVCARPLSACVRERDERTCLWLCLC